MPPHAILAQLEDAHAMLREAKARRERLKAELGEAQASVEALVVETERLERELLDCVRGVGEESEDDALMAVPRISVIPPSVDYGG